MLFGCETFEFGIMTVIHNAVQSDSMDFIMCVISELGNGGMIWIAVTAVLFSKKKYRVLSLKLALGLILGLILGNIMLKNLIARPRPCWMFDNINMLIDVPKDFSFPSGHTLSSFTAAFLLLSEDRRMGIPAIILATLIAVSRIYLFVHFPTDILGGMMLSGIIFVILKKFEKRTNA
jgi:undecaprenyl-diphosphatase